MAYAQLAATVTTRAHFLLDVPAGLLLAELVSRTLLLPCVATEARAAEQPTRTTPLRRAVLVCAMATVPVVLFLVHEHLCTLTGWAGMANMWS
jgi:hypothetical protein